MRKLYKILPFAIIFTVAISTYLSGIYKFVSFETIREHQDFLKEYTAQNKFASIAIFFILYFFVVSFSIPVGTIMTFLSGYLFGQVTGTICVVVAATFGACVMFLSTKMASQETLQKKISTLNHRMQKGFEKNAFAYVLTLRLTPIFPFLIVNLAAGILQVSFRSFFFGTLIGIIPITAIYVSIGSSMQKILDTEYFSYNILLEPQIVISLVALAMLALLPTIFKKTRKK